MKIAIVIDSILGVGGASRQALYLASELTKTGQDVAIYTYYWDENSEYKELFGNIEIISLYKTESEWRTASASLQENKLLKRLHQSFVLNKKNLQALALLIPTDVDVINPHSSCHPITRYVKRLNPKLVSVAMINDPDLNRWSAIRFGIKENIFKKIFRFLSDLPEVLLLKQHNKIIVLDHLNRVWMKKLAGVEATVVRSGLDIQHFAKNQNRSMAAPTKNDTIRLLGIGILMEHRRFEDAILAIKILRNEGYNATLTIIGAHDSTNPYKLNLDTIIRENHLTEYIILLNKISEEELVESFASHHFFVFPNHLQTWGLAIFEAMASKLPVIVSNSTGGSEMLTHKENAWIISPKNPADIAEAIIRLSNDPEQYKTISENGYDFVSKNISWTKYATAMLEQFKSVQK
ncbi:hypothetical protein COU14_01495 [Candidatus Kaiserbacteria bacterium CG10_big_fil_rev_8_21_14_0_10_44_10]|uniref:Glycosyl transferase family 1 domain-containing protein n=1 Tax=Candidatus Kaiserbacteria bacterium CG10_big_fil_rev_8_21_14_0_10_44_10 TaxID=1974606 RepID=A0A2H0UHQ6_9BACT|nr:MAG: hypothetical protein COU14_01495 [Candidatus Kaiserbacteria bacterium CG10_big_fil_rev_8_21_14_0_10_44_10]